MAHFHTKRKKGRPYLYVREMGRVHGKVKVISQVYIGPPERVAALVRDGEDEDRSVKVEEFGALWLAEQMDRDIGLVDLVDAIIPRRPREEGPSVGEFFLYAVLNRMVDATSKLALPAWYKNTAIQTIRPVEITALTSQNYWKKWSRVSEEDLAKISLEFFRRLCKVEKPEADCLLFDTTNYYTFMASDTPSDLAQRGKNKASRDHLRQVGLACLVARGSRLPLYYATYPGNIHDSKLFGQIIGEMFGALEGCVDTKRRMTIVIDKGMNSEENFAWIDDHSHCHFITTYSPYFAEELVSTTLERFEPLDTETNRRLIEDDKAEDRMLAWRTTGDFWGGRRTVVVTYYPPSARKQTYTLDSKLEALRAELLEMRTKARAGAPQWRDPEVIKERYVRACERLHLPTCLYDISFGSGDGEAMSFTKNSYQVDRRKQQMGKNIIVTDNTDWTTKDIVEASIDRWQVEDRFRQSKNDDLVGTMPIRHWTDGKIECHLFTCMVALAFLRRLELRLSKAGINRTAADVMADMRNLHSILSLNLGRRNAQRRLETPSETQAAVLSALQATIDAKGVLQLK